MSLYPPNQIKWKPGDIVLHHADSKHPKMFMRVRGYNRHTGLCETVYLHQQYSHSPRLKNDIYQNEIANLLNPLDFGLTGQENPHAFERVRLWNFYNRLGTPLMVNGQPTFSISEAWLEGFHFPVLLVNGISRPIHLGLDQIEVIRGDTVSVIAEHLAHLEKRDHVRL